jgi:hypothetical protein
MPITARAKREAGDAEAGAAAFAKKHKDNGVAPEEHLPGLPCPDRADDQRASDCFRRGTLCMLACVVQGILYA